MYILIFFFFKQKTAYEMRISDWSSDVCSSDLQPRPHRATAGIEDQDIELGVIGLPDRIGVFGAVPMHQLELVAEGGSTFMCQGQHRQIDPPHDIAHAAIGRSEEHTSELQSLMRISYAVFCLTKTITMNVHKSDTMTTTN